jgi:hypothetical protein
VLFSIRTKEYLRSNKKKATYDLHRRTPKAGLLDSGYWLGPKKGAIRVLCAIFMERHKKSVLERVFPTGKGYPLAVEHEFLRSLGVLKYFITFFSRIS